MKTVIVGSSGWVSRAAESLLVSSPNVPASDVLFYGSHDRVVSFGLRNYNVQRWSVTTLEEPVATFLPFAFHTVDRYQIMGPDRYKSENEELIRKSVAFIQHNQPQKCVVISSGIVYSDLRLSPRNDAYSAYAALKKREEEAIALACEEVGTSLVICRLFSASGRHMPEPQKYAIGNMIIQAIHQGRISVDSSFAVFRRYVDMAQVLEICFKWEHCTQPLIFDSAGHLVELHDLAIRISEIFGIKRGVYEVDVNNEDNYYSRSNRMESLASSLGIELFDLDEQIRNTALSISASM